MTTSSPASASKRRKLDASYDTGHNLIAPLLRAAATDSKPISDLLPDVPPVIASPQGRVHLDEVPALRDYLTQHASTSSWSQLFSIGYWSDCGRHAECNTQLEAGTLLFIEQPVVCSIDNDAEDEDRWSAITEQHSSYSVGRLQQAWRVLQDDKLTQLVLCMSRHEDAVHCAERRSVAQLMCEQCQQTANVDSLSVDTIDHVLDALDTNCHGFSVVDNSSNSSKQNGTDDAEQAVVCSGDGLYPLLAMFNHSCRETCAFTAAEVSHDSTGTPTSVSMRVSVMRPTTKYQSLTVSYVSCYTLTRERLSYLDAVYGFHCFCKACNHEAWDVCRVFVCIKCNGPFTPLNDDTQWRCRNASCQHKCTDTERLHYIRTEQTIYKLVKYYSPTTSILSDNRDTEASVDVDAIAEVVAAIGTGFDIADISQRPLYSLLHPSHAYIHYALDVLADYMVEQQRYKTALTLVHMRLDNLDQLCSTPSMTMDHHMRATEMDRISHIAEAVGDLQQARAALQEAYRINCQCFGQDASVKMLQRIKQLDASNSQSDTIATA